MTVTGADHAFNCSLGRAGSTSCVRLTSRTRKGHSANGRDGLTQPVRQQSRCQEKSPPVALAANVTPALDNFEKRAKIELPSWHLGTMQS